jgi:hypothetical protein
VTALFDHPPRHMFFTGKRVPRPSRLRRDRPRVDAAHPNPEPDSAKVRSTAEVARRIQAGRAIIVHGGLAAGRKHDVELMPLHQFLLAPDKAVAS